MDIDTASAIGIFYGLASEYGLTAAPLNRDESEVWHDVTIDGKVRLRFVIEDASVIDIYEFGPTEVLVGQVHITGEAAYVDRRYRLILREAMAELSA